MLRPLLALILAFPLGAQSPARGLRDQQIEQEIRLRLAKSVIGKENFQVRVREGVAHWEGTTLVPQRKGAATRMAKSAGARSVVNNIVVRPAPVKPPGKPTATPKAVEPRGASAPVPLPPVEPRRVKVQWGPRP